MFAVVASNVEATTQTNGLLITFQNTMEPLFLKPM
jgi:hypothetical protein